jgi:hypothetical protein
LARDVRVAIRTGGSGPACGHARRRTLVPADPDAVDPEIRVSWHQAITVIDCGANLERITCPHCGTDIDTGWWGICSRSGTRQGSMICRWSCPAVVAATL